MAMMTKQNYLLIGSFSFGLIGTFVAYQVSWQFDDRLFFVFLLIPFSLICLMPAIVRLWQSNFDPFEPPTFMGFMYLLSFGLLSLPLLDREAQFFAFLGNDFHWLNMAILYLGVGLMVLWLGYWSRVALWIEHLFRLDQDHPSKELTPQIIFAWVPTIYAIGTIARIYLISTGTYGYLKAQYRDVAEAQLPFTNFLSHIQLFCSYALVLSAICYFTGHDVKKTIIFYFLVLVEIFFGLVSGYRTPIYLTFFFIGIVYFYIFRRIPMRCIIIGLLVILSDFPLIKTYRDLINSGTIDTVNTEEVLSSIWTAFTETTSDGGLETIIEGSKLASSRMNLIQSLASVIKFGWEHGTYPDRHLVILMPFLAFIPRAIWPNKPQLQLGYWFYTEVLGGSTITSVDTTFVGALYLYFGFWGYLAAMFSVGTFQKFAYRRYSVGNSLVKVFFAPFVVLALANTDSNFVAHFAGLVQQFIVMMIISKIIFRRLPMGSSHMVPLNRYTVQLRHGGS
jgi:hypothetical protein